MSGNGYNGGGGGRGGLNIVGTNMDLKIVIQNLNNIHKMKDCCDQSLD